MPHQRRRGPFDPDERGCHYSDFHHDFSGAHCGQQDQRRCGEARLDALAQGFGLQRADAVIGSKRT
jgi:hypothetical protein